MDAVVCLQSRLAEIHFHFLISSMFSRHNSVRWKHFQFVSLLLCLNSGSASIGGAFEGQLCHNAVRRLSQSDCSFFSLFLEDALLLSFAASHILRYFARLKIRKKERKWRRMQTLKCAPGEHLRTGINMSCLSLQ